MLLAVDVGNTNTVFAVRNGDKWLSRWRLVTDHNRTSDEYVVWLDQLLKLQDLSLKDLECMIVSSVVPATLQHLTAFSKTYLNRDPMIVGSSQIDLGIQIRIDEPASVGADRLANAVGASTKYQGDLIVIDFGTATTFDLIEGDGAYAGGIISPGINLSIEALQRAAAKLPHVAIEMPKSVIGGDTVSAMQSGIYWGYVSLIEGLVARIKEEKGQHLKVIATGGLSYLFSHGTEDIEHIDDDLTIDGLYEIYCRNKAAIE